MGYGDLPPPSGRHAKKPLTKKQLQKMREKYARAEDISKHIQKIEEVEEKKIKKDITTSLDSLFL